MQTCIHTYIKTSGSESRPRKVELMRTHINKNAKTTVSILHITTRPDFVPTKTSRMAMIFISLWSLLDHH